MHTLPIRVLEILESDGTRSRTLHVFCAQERASIPPERCARCNYRCPPVDGARAPAVGCRAQEGGEDDEPTSKDAPLVFGPEAAALRVPAGLASAQVVVCIQADATLATVRAGLSAYRHLAYPVVNADRVLLGCVPVAALPADEGALDPLLTAQEVMVQGIVVRESDRVEDAITAMTSHHARHVAIVDAHGHLTGGLSDLDVLRWVARGAPRRWW